MGLDTRTISELLIPDSTRHHPNHGETFFTEFIAEQECEHIGSGLKVSVHTEPSPIPM